MQKVIEKVLRQMQDKIDRDIASLEKKHKVKAE